MPQFVMEGRDNPDFADLDLFIHGYIEAMFWTESAGGDYTIDNWFSDETQEAVSEGQSDGEIPSDAGFNELHPDALDEIISDCIAFQDKANKQLCAAYAMETVSYTAEQAGHDYWLTRNGHGVGYWDRGLGQVGADLSELAHSQGGAAVFFGDHVTHGNAPFVHYHN